MKRVFLLTIAVALHIFLLVACGKNNTSNYPQGRGYNYNARYGDYFRNFPSGGYNQHRYDACGQGWSTGWHYQRQEKFCFDASFHIGFDLYPFDNYSGILCNPNIPSDIACPWGSYCRPVTSYYTYSYYSDLGFCTRIW